MMILYEIIFDSYDHPAVSVTVSLPISRLVFTDPISSGDNTAMHSFRCLGTTLISDVAYKAI
jgi:hypothetical protein